MARSKQKQSPAPTKMRGDSTKWQKKNLSPSQKAYLKRQSTDYFAQKAHKEGFSSRAAYKLQEIDQKFNILSHASSILDLGCAPGGWLQIIYQTNPKAYIAGIDLIHVSVPADVHFLQGDFTDPEILASLQKPDNPYWSVILSDMAPNTTGHAETDHLKSMALAEAAASFALENLEVTGHFVCKLFQGSETDQFIKYLKEHFHKVRLFKPEASRDESREVFAVALDKKPDVL